MIWFLSCVALAALILAGFLVFEMRSVRASYEQIYSLLIRDRDQAREEVATLRRALFPQLERLTGPTPPRSPVSPRPNQTSAAAPLPNTRTPFRVRFKQMVAAHNTKQIATDRLAQAIENSETS